MAAEIRLLANISTLDRCPQCGVSRPNLILKGWMGDDLKPAHLPSPVWFSYQCSTCIALVGIRALAPTQSLVNNIAHYLYNNNIISTDILPRSEAISNSLPEKPRNYLIQAIASMHAPDGAVMLAGSAIDAMLQIKGFTVGSVYKRIEEAVEQNILTEDMSKWAHAVRLESNKPRHADLLEPNATAELAKQTIIFKKALGDFLFVLPATVARGTADAEAKIKA